VVRDIVVVEDPRLRTKCPRVPKIDASIQKLIDDLVDTMRAAPGIGLAAPQVGVLLRVIVCEVDENLHTLVNPEIVRAEGEQVGDEGCLSIPGYQGEVKRALKVTVKGKNRNGKDVRIKAEGLLARIELDWIRVADGTNYRIQAEGVLWSPRTLWPVEVPPRSSAPLAIFRGNVERSHSITSRSAYNVSAGPMRAEFSQDM